MNQYFALLASVDIHSTRAFPTTLYNTHVTWQIQSTVFFSFATCIKGAEFCELSQTDYRGGTYSCSSSVIT